MTCSIMHTSKCKIQNTDIHTALGYMELEPRKAVVAGEKTGKAPAI